MLLRTRNSRFIFVLSIIVALFFIVMALIGGLIDAMFTLFLTILTVATMFGAFYVILTIIEWVDKGE